MKPLNWRAWYTRNRRYNSKTHDWEHLPVEGCLLFVVYMDEFTRGGFPYRKIVAGGDWYWIDEEGMVRCSDTHEGRDEWIDPPEDVDPALLKRGVWTTDEIMNRVQSDATEARWSP